MKSIKRIIAITAIALAAGTAFAAITEKEAVDIALKSAGVSHEEVIRLASHHDWDDRRPCFDVEFSTDEGRWEYEIDSESGRILEYGFKAHDPIHHHGTRPQAPAAVHTPNPAPEPKVSPAATAVRHIDRTKAEEIALSDVSLTRNDVSRLRTEPDREDGRRVYEVKFNTPESEYEYMIGEDDGSIIKASWERRGRIGGDRDARLTQEEAIEIASKAFGPGAERLRVWEDRDDGRFFYEAEALVNGCWMEADIAGTGEIVKLERDYRGYRR